MSKSPWKMTNRATELHRAAWEADARANATASPRPSLTVHRRIDHHAQLSSIAWVDAKRLVGLDVGGTALTVDEVYRYSVGSHVTRARALALQPLVAPPSHKPPAEQSAAELSLGALQRQARAIHRRLLRALDLRFANSPEGRARLTDIRRGRSLQDLLDDTVSLRALVTAPQHRAWFAALPRGEAGEFARLEVLDAELRARREASLREDDSEAAEKLRQARAELHAMLAMLDALERRIVLAGRYAWQDDGRAKQYRRYVSTLSRRPRKRKGPQEE